MAEVRRARRPIGILDLPVELRLEIWSSFMRDCDPGALLATHQTISDDVRLAFPELELDRSCACEPGWPCSCGLAIEVDELKIIAEPACSGSHWLKFTVVEAGQHRSRTWAVRDLDSPFARLLCYFSPRNMVVEFRSPPEMLDPRIVPPDRRLGLEDLLNTNDRLTPFILVLRAKIFDICEVIEWVQPQWERNLAIHFADPWMKTGVPPTLPSFWDFKMMVNTTPRCASYCDSSYLMGRIYDTKHWGCFKSPQYDVCLLLPICLHRYWRNAVVRHDRDNMPDSCLELWRKDANKVALASWAYMENLISDGILPGRGPKETGLTPYMAQYEVYAQIWASLRRPEASSSRPARNYRKQNMYALLRHQLEFSYFNGVILACISCRRDGSLEQLRAHILRTRASSALNSFSGRRPDGEALEWNWNLDLVRQNYIQWASNELAKNDFIDWRKGYEPLWPYRWPRTLPLMEGPDRRFDIYHICFRVREFCQLP